MQGIKSRIIDVHHHYFPPSLDKAKNNQSIGWKTPSENLPWSPEISLRAMDELAIQMAILSHPPISAGTVGEANRALARENNLLAAKVCADHPSRFGFFGTLPFLDDVEGALQEIKYVLDELHADGIALASSYGEGVNAKYIAHDQYDPIWRLLNQRKAVVFLHGAQTPSSAAQPSHLLGVPITEVPNETFKAAAHLIVTAKKRLLLPDVKVILAHMGGSTTLLAARVAVLSCHMGCTLTREEIMHDFATFYYETALSACEVSLRALETFVQDPGRILLGTDFPAVSTDMANWYTKNVEEYCKDHADKLEAITRRNAINLFPKLQRLLDDTH